MAGTLPGFDAVAFRDGILTAMVMGLPNAVLDQPTFLIYPPRDSDDEVDVGGNPYDWQPSTSEPERVLIPCAVEVTRGAGGEMTQVGAFTPSDALLTVLDIHYPQIEGFSEVLLGSDTYVYVKQMPPLGLAEVTVHQFLVRARSES